MKKILLFIALLLIMIIPASYKAKRMDYREARYKNVCKDLKGDVLLYFIFIDSKYTAPWTEFDIQSTIDSLRAAITWLHSQARSHKILLNIRADFYIGPEFTTITRNLPEPTVLESVTNPNMRKAKENLNRWSDAVSKIAGASVTIHEKDGIPAIKPPKNKERLVAFLRDENKVESVALFFLVNNYFKADISTPVNMFDTEDVEFAIVSYKYPSEIVHNFLHLYGAADMHKSVYRRQERKISMLAEMYPNDVMQDPYGKAINKLELSDYTQYLIGWSDELDPELETLMTDKMLNF
ncbi:MAG: hypothetical protein AMS26_12065 [Bacteroides sp. SM23_62]|nr:MAG: hypothetical protein AMS26_12065 [Bacteroides sp. SM23_62]